MSLVDRLHKHLILPAWNRRQGMDPGRFRPRVEAALRAGPDALRREQWTAVRDMLSYAGERVPFYRDRFEGAGVVVESLTGIEDLARVPILTKEEMRRDPMRLLDPTLDVSRLNRSGTGGTTDSPIPFFYDDDRRDMKLAEMEVFRSWYGWTPSSKVAYLWGAALDIPDLGSWKYRVRSRWVERRLYLLAARLNPSIMDEYADRLDAFGPEIIQAYSNPAHILAAHLLATGRRVRPPKAVIVTAEPCTAAQRAIIAEAFGCPVHSFYGAREAGYIAAECPEGGRFHVNAHGLHLEIVKEGRPVATGEMGHVILTDLLNLAMPLIRYQIGDLAALSPDHCPCGRALPVLEFFAGRETDVFVTPDGDLVPGVSLCDRVVTECAGFAQLQFIQDVPEKLVVKLVKGPDYSDRDMRVLDEALRDYFGGRLAIEKVFVDDIPRAASGKTRFCISNVPVPLLGRG